MSAKYDKFSLAAHKDAHEIEALHAEIDRLRAHLNRSLRETWMVENQYAEAVATIAKMMRATSC